MSQAPEDSPNELTPAPHVRRLNRVPLLIAGLLLSVLIAARGCARFLKGRARRGLHS